MSHSPDYASNGGSSGGSDSGSLGAKSDAWIVRIGIGHLQQQPLRQQNGVGQEHSGTGGPRQRALDEWMADAFRWLGVRVAEWRLQTVGVVLLFSALCFAAIPLTPQEDDLKSGYTPRGARSHDELARYERFFGGGGGAKGPNRGGETGPISVVVFVTARDNGSLLRESLLDETVALMDVLANDFSLGGRTFAQFCSDFCQFNEPNGFRMQLANASSGGVADPIVNLSFPIMSILGRQIDLSPHFFGVALSPNGQLASARLVVLQFRAERQHNVSKEEVARWERQIADYLHKDYRGDIRPLAFTMTFVADEVVRTGMTLFPFLSVGFATMCLFSVCTVWISARYFAQWTRQKVLMAVVACVCPLLACSSALGLLFWAGFRFGTILCVSPFLVMAIGVDDAFLMIQSWQRISLDRQLLRQSGVPAQMDTVRERIAAMLVDVGPSITITSATNVLAFCVGIFTPTPEIQLFCAGNAMAIFFDYLYQLFLFTPALAVLGKMEIADEDRRAMRANTRRDVLRTTVSRLIRSYCEWISSGFTALFVLAVLSVYWICTVRSALQIVPNITPRKLFLADSPVNEVNDLRDAYVLPNYMPVSIFVDRAGDLSNASRRQSVEDLVADFEREPFNLGRQFTHFWMRDFQRYSAEIEFEEEEETTAEVGNNRSNNGSPFRRDQMSGFLSWPEYRHWNGFLHFDSKSGELDRFFVITAFHGVELVDWSSRARQLARWREIADKYTDLGAFVWVEEAQFLDQIDTLVPATVQSSIATLLCMSLVCFVFMSNIFTVVVATLSIVSICVGAFGLLAFWGIDLDPISMATTIMSIGFSVDFPAHLAYHYYRCGSSGDRLPSPVERVHDALVAIGFPLLQCGLSTILFVLCLLFVDTYMSEVFVKSIFLVVSLGLLHGLVIVPTLLCAVSNAHSCWRSLKPKLFPDSGATLRNGSTQKTAKNLPRRHSSKLVIAVAGPG